MKNLIAKEGCRRNKLRKKRKKIPSGFFTGLEARVFYGENKLGASNIILSSHEEMEKASIKILQESPKAKFWRATIWNDFEIKRV